MKHSCWVWLVPLFPVVMASSDVLGQESPEAKASGKAETGLNEGRGHDEGRGQDEGRTYLWSWGDVAKRIEVGTAAVKAAWVGVEASQALKQSTGAWPNPEVGVEAMGFGVSRPWLGPEETSVTFRQAIPLGGRLNSEREAAGAAQVKAEAEAGDTVEGLRARAFLRFLGALTCRDREVLERERLALSEKAASLVLARVRAGALPEAELSRSDATVALARSQVGQAQRRAKAALHALASVWGGGADEVAGVVGELESLPVPEPLPVVLQRMGQAPGLKAVEAQVFIQAKQAELEAALAVPDLTVGAGGVWFGAFGEAALVLSVEWPLPVFDRNQAKVDEARAKQRQASYQVESWKQEWAAALLEVHSEYEQYYETQSVLVKEVIPALERAAAAVEKGFQNGQLTTLDLLESHSALLEARVELLEARQQAWEAALTVDYMTGQLGRRAWGGTK